MKGESLKTTDYFSVPAWQPLCAVGSHGLDGSVNAQICISISSASIVPDRPRLLVTLWKQNLTHDLVLAASSLCISLMHAGQLGLVAPLGLQTGRDAPKLGEVDIELTPSGDPYLVDSIGYADCSVADQMDVGDATVFLVFVRHEYRLREGEPVTWARAAELLPRAVLDRYNEKFSGDVALAKQTMTWCT